MGKKSKAKRASPPPSDKGGKRTKPPEEQGSPRVELWWLLPALVLGFLVYLNALQGEFVYDDQLQISRNTLIQDGSQIWRALTSDVWGFQGGDQTQSNYWRPSYIIWLILSFRCFGFEVVGWHLANVLLHLAVITLAFAVLRQFAVSAPVAGAIALIFAVHPVHCESVAWISGAPDLVLSTALLGSLYFVHLLGKKKTSLRWVLSIGLYLVALGAKEVALLFPLLIVAVLSRSDREAKERNGSWARIWSITWPFVVVAVIYFLTRRSILGVTQRVAEGGASLPEAILTAPAVFAFYLRQMIAPFWIGPLYPLRAVTPKNIGVGNFIIPLVVTIVAAWWMIRTAKLSKTARIGLALFLVPLVPVMNIMAFSPEHLVHDRYLYLSLLGFLMLFVTAFTSLLHRIGSERITRPSLLIFIVALILSVPLAAQAIIYNRAWTSNLALCERGIRSDPSSADNYQRYGTSLYEAKRLDEAIAAFNRSIEIAPMPSTYVVRAAAWIDQHKYAEAERDLRAVTSQKRGTAYTFYRAYRDLADCISNQGRTDEAVDVIKQARIRLPSYTAALTGKLSSILWRAGRTSEALSEFNGARAQARTESLPESRLLLYGLGVLNLELGHSEDARAAFLEFLSVTQGMLAPGVKQARAEAEIRLRDLGH